MCSARGNSSGGFWRDEGGQASVEYILILSMAVAIFVAFRRIIKPILERVGRRMAEDIDKRLSNGVYQLNF